MVWTSIRNHYRISTRICLLKGHKSETDFQRDFKPGSWVAVQRNATSVPSGELFLPWTEPCLLPFLVILAIITSRPTDPECGYPDHHHQHAHWSRVWLSWSSLSPCRLILSVVILVTIISIPTDPECGYPDHHRQQADWSWVRLSWSLSPACWLTPIVVILIITTNMPTDPKCGYPDHHHKHAGQW